MNFAQKLRIKANTLADYYLFQSGGIPKINKDRIAKAVLKKFLPSRPVVVDCGAHDGADSVELARILKAEVHAFEPVPGIFERLKTKTARYPAIHCYEMALSNIDGTQEFHVSEGGSDASSSLLEPQDHLLDHPDTYFKKVIPVRTMTLDHWATAHKISKVDLLWLDMQGFELQMLQASGAILDTVSLIHTEVSLKSTYKGVTLFKDYKSFLESKGFKVLIEAIPQGWDMGNVLFVR